MWHKQKQQGVRNVFYPAQKNASLLDVQGKDKKKIKKVYYFLHLKFTYTFSSFEVLFSHFIPIYRMKKKQIVNYFTFKIKFNKVTYESVLIKVIVKISNPKYQLIQTLRMQFFNQIQN